MMQLAISTWSVHRELPNTRGIETPGRLDLPGFFDLCRDRFGVGGVELWSGHLLESGDPAYLADLAVQAREAGLDVVNLACDHGKVGAADPAARQENQATLRRWVGAAAALGSRAIRVNTAGADGRSDEETFRAVVAGYRELLPAVRGAGLLLLMENHGGLSSDPAMIGRIFDGVDDEAFRACPDNGNFPPEVRRAGLRAMVPPMAMAHLKMLDFDADGEEASFDIPAIVALYREGGFDGPVSIEFEGPGDQLEGLDRCAALARRAIGE